jgi:hypothetical protein
VSEAAINTFEKNYLDGKEIGSAKKKPLVKKRYTASVAYK